MNMWGYDDKDLRVNALWRAVEYHKGPNQPETKAVVATANQFYNFLKGDKK